MQVCLETLLSGINLSEEKRLELIERCYTNNERLRRLLSEASLITRMEDGSQLINKESVVVNNIIDEIAGELEIMPEEERFGFHVDFDEPVIVGGNPSLIVSIFRNLTENAIAYSGGKNIYISLIENNENLCRIRFEDDGCGVDDKHLSRLFERFYRVDKGRSRQIGGTGLGLAIVKHAVQFHGGSIIVSNRPSGGLRFDFFLRK
jgi:signal transduction histidine kinase